MTPSKRKTLIDEIWKTRKLSDQDSEDPIFLLYWLNVDPRPKESHDLVYEGTGFSKSNWKSQNRYDWQQCIIT